MELKVMEYDTTSIRYLNQKKTLNTVFLFLFALSLVASIGVFVLLFREDVQISIYLLTGAQIIASAIYIVTCVAIIKDCNRILEAIVQNNGNYKEQLQVPYKIDIDKNISGMALLYLLCAVVIFAATVFCVVALILTFTITMLAEVLFTILILMFALLMSFSTIIDDNRIKKIMNNKKN